MDKLSKEQLIKLIQKRGININEMLKNPILERQDAIIHLNMDDYYQYRNFDSDIIEETCILLSKKIIYIFRKEGTNYVYLRTSETILGYSFDNLKCILESYIDLFNICNKLEFPYRIYDHHITIDEEFIHKLNMMRILKELL